MATHCAFRRMTERALQLLLLPDRPCLLLDIGCGSGISCLDKLEKALAIRSAVVSVVESTFTKSAQKMSKAVRPSETWLVSDVHLHSECIFLDSRGAAGVTD